MSNSFKPASFLFYVLTLIAFFFMGMFLAAIVGAAEGQGLAGGAIVLFYGLITAVVALIIAILVARKSSLKRIKQLNVVLGVVVLIVGAYMAYRIADGSPETEFDRSPPKQPVPTEVPAN